MRYCTSDGTLVVFGLPPWSWIVYDGRRHEPSHPLDCDPGLEPGDLLLGMTDGLPETLDPHDEMLGYAALKPPLVELADRGVDEVLEGFMDASRRWADGRSPEDDLTLIVVRRSLAPKSL